MHFKLKSALAWVQNSSYTVTSKLFFKRRKSRGTPKRQKEVILYARTMSSLKSFQNTQVLGILHNFLTFVFKRKIKKLCSMTKKIKLQRQKLFNVAKINIACYNIIVIKLMFDKFRRIFYGIESVSKAI